jgi:thiamine pyrophosphokinase
MTITQMSKRICYIVGAGENSGIRFLPSEDDLVIAADGGYRYLLDAGIRTDIVVGDFDSSAAPSAHPYVVRLKKEKDDTDTGAAVQLGLQKGYTDFVFYGCTGGRIEHTIANIQLLDGLAERRCRGVLVGKEERYTVIKDSTLVLSADNRGRISVFFLENRRKA